jgi:hypothetical protein
MRFIYKTHAYHLSDDLSLYTNSIDKKAKSGFNPREIKTTLSSNKEAGITTKRA